MSILRPRSQTRLGPMICRAGFLVITTVSLLGGGAAAPGNSSASKKPACSTQPLASGDEYAGSAPCAPCHREIYDKFSRTGMGRSMSVATTDWLSTFHTSGSVENKDLNLHLEVYSRDGKLYQTQYET